MKLNRVRTSNVDNNCPSEDVKESEKYPSRGNERVHGGEMGVVSGLPG